jgi:hypothetical protein
MVRCTRQAGTAGATPVAAFATERDQSLKVAASRTARCPGRETTAVSR